MEFYYLWKKTERADQFANKTRLEKKKYTFNQNVTDLMEKYLGIFYLNESFQLKFHLINFVEEYDGTNRERDRSASPNVNNSLLFTDIKRVHRSSANNATADSSGNNNDHKVIKQQVQATIPTPPKATDQ